MSKTKEPTQGQTQDQAPEGPQQAPDLPLIIHTQYLKDLSFENPNAPEILKPRQGRPKMALNIALDVQPLEDENIKDFYEVIMSVTATARHEDKVAFIAEVTFGAAVSFLDVPKPRQHPMLMIEVPRLMFPFARHMLATVTQAGGYPALLLNMVDFRAMYKERFATRLGPAEDSEEAAAE